MSELNIEQIMADAVREGLREGIKSKFNSGYNSPLNKLVDAAIEAKAGEFRALLDESIATCLTATDFREHIATSVRSVMAKTLIQRFGGEMEKQVNVLKSDPTTRARITLAIEEIVKSQM